MPRVTVVTPTWLRHDLLLNRCMPSVSAQTYPPLLREHLVVCDGPDPELGPLVRAAVPKADVTAFGAAEGEHEYVDAELVRFYELSENHDDLGAAARNFGVEHSDSELVAFLDDDNAFRPRHLEVLVDALDAHPEAGFAYSKFYYPERGTEMGVAPPTMGQIDGSTFVARRELFELARWEAGAYALDWQLIEGWLRAGVGWAFVDEVTMDYWWKPR